MLMDASTDSSVIEQELIYVSSQQESVKNAQADSLKAAIKKVIRNLDGATVMHEIKRMVNCYSY